MSLDEMLLVDAEWWITLNGKWAPESSREVDELFNEWDNGPVEFVCASDDTLSWFALLVREAIK